MSPEHPEYPLFRAVVDGELTEPFYARYVRFMAKSAADIGERLTELGGPLTGTETRVLRESSRPETRESLARAVKRMSRPERAALATTVLGDLPG
jgi:hypothetical protein